MGIVQLKKAFAWYMRRKSCCKAGLLCVVLFVLYVNLGKTGRLVRHSRPTPLRNRILMEEFTQTSGIVTNTHTFRFLLTNEDICKGDTIHLLIYVHSAPGNYRRRVVIRDTWGNPSVMREFAGIRIVFMLGLPATESDQKAILLENDIYKDIVQEDYVDSYRNLTYKGIQALRWVSTYCSTAQYVLKTDDDAFVNIFSLLKHLHVLQESGHAQANAIFCNVWDRMIVERNVSNKWYVSETEVKDSIYPTYCSGLAYIVSRELVPKMYSVAFRIKFFWIDDVFITGLLAREVGATHVDFGSLYEFHQEDLVQYARSGKVWSILFSQLKDLDHMYYMWDLVKGKFCGSC